MSLEIYAAIATVLVLGSSALMAYACIRVADEEDDDFEEDCIVAPTVIIQKATND